MSDFFRVPSRSFTRFSVALAVVGLVSSGPRADPRRPPSQAHHGLSVRIAPPPRAPEQPPTASNVPSALTTESVQLLQLRSAPFPSPSRPGALVYVPAGIDKREPLSVVVFIHGWNGCPLAVSSDQPAPCHPDGPRRGHLALVSQLRESRRAAILIVPQMAPEARSSAPGQLGDPGGLARLLSEALSQMEPSIGAHSVEDIQHLALASHSGGYVTVARLIELNEVRFDQIAMFDSLYLSVPTFERYITSNLDRLALGAARPLRFVSLYRGGATQGSTRALERLVTAAVSQHTPAITIFSRRTPDRVSSGEASAALVFARVTGDHQQAVRLNLAAVLESSAITETSQ